ncbi:MAG: helix-turn-helix domain-containing protein [Clostridia bacterium]|nr:helix-turn-helix domain-containing protein [Clostridia bacterium]
MNWIAGSTIRDLRLKKQMTQKDLADRLSLSDKTISKWETDKGLPDISIIADLAEVLSVSVSELLTGAVAENKNRGANMRRSKFYICPVCGNVIHAMGEGAFSCCGIRLPAAEAESMDEAHDINIETSDGDIYATMDHPMEKGHYISFIGLLRDNSFQMEKLYPEQNAEARFRMVGRGTLICYCNRHGLFTKKL